MDAVPLIGTAIISTAHMSLFYWLMSRFQIASKRARPMIRSFTIPEKSYLSPGTLLLHLAAGFLFTVLYTYVLVMLHQESFALIVSIGVLMGFTHGFFLDFFMLLGFSGLMEPRTPTLGIMVTVLLSIFSHMLFGFSVGLGVAMKIKTDTWTTYLAWGLVSLVVLTMIGIFASPVVRRGAPRRRLMRS